MCWLAACINNPACLRVLQVPFVGQQNIATLLEAAPATLLSVVMLLALVLGLVCMCPAYHQLEASLMLQAVRIAECVGMLC